MVTKDPNNDKMVFSVSVPKSPDYFIIFEAKMTFLEYFIHVISCFGIWFGVSILSLNPLQYKKYIIKLFNSKETTAKSNEDGCARKNILRKLDNITNRSCLYCSQTRIVVLSELKQRLHIVKYLKTRYSIDGSIANLGNNQF
jgi:hypothetical protein